MGGKGGQQGGEDTFHANGMMERKRAVVHKYLVGGRLLGSDSFPNFP